MTADYEEPRFRVEAATTGKARCRRTGCGELIKQGELRLGVGVWNEPAGEWWTQWRHWHCVPPQQFKKMYENWSVTELPGFKKLSDEHKAQVRKAYAAGRAEPAPAPGSAKKEEAKKEEVKEPTPEPEPKGPEAIAFKVDVASRVAMCRAPKCMEEKKKVEPGELRLGIIYDDKKSTWMYKHWMCATREDLVGADQAKKDCELEGFDTLTDSQKSVVTRSLRHKRPVELVAQVTAGLEELSVVN